MSDSERRPLELPRYGNDMLGDLLASVFEPFANFDSPLFNRGDRPSLAIVQQFAWAHDGEIWAESEPGQGTQLSLRNPCLTRNPNGVISDDPPAAFGTRRVAQRYHVRSCCHSAHPPPMHSTDA